MRIEDISPAGSAEFKTGGVILINYGNRHRPAPFSRANTGICSMPMLLPKVLIA
jgi:hypothetical protein